MLITLKTEIDCDNYSTPEMVGLESICVKVKLSKSALFIYNLYIQPSSSIEVYEKHLIAINSVKRAPNDIIDIFGDWNLPIIKWIPNDDGFDFVPVIGESQCREAIIAKRVTGFMLEAG